jgi:CBS domain-containing protein
LLVVEGGKLVGILTVSDMLGLLHKLVTERSQSAGR